MVHAGWRLPAEYFLLPPVIVLPVKPPQLPPEMGETCESHRQYEITVKGFMIRLYLPSPAGVVGLAEDGLYPRLPHIFLEGPGDELFAIVHIDFSRNPAPPQCPSQGIDRLLFALPEVCL